MRTAKVIAVGAFVFYFTWITGDKYATFFTALLFAAITYWVFQSEQVQQKEEVAVSANFWEAVAKDMKNYDMVFPTIYGFHKAPKTLKYIYYNRPLKRVLEDLTFLRSYEKDAFLRLILLLEYFSKVQYNVVIGKYDPCYYMPVLKDTRQELLGLFNSFRLNMHPTSKIVNIPDLWAFLADKERDVRGLTMKSMNVVRRKFGSACEHAMELGTQPMDMAGHV